MVGENCGDLPQITPLDGEVRITKSFRTGTGTGTRTDGQGQGEWDARM